MNNQGALGKYRLLEELGVGSFAQLYKAQDDILKRHVAIKVLLPFYLNDPRFVNRFYQEARIVASLTHRNVITIHEVGSESGRLFIVMELATGSLASLIAQKRGLPWRVALDLLKPICSGLDFAHSRGVIHCDLKPANILLNDAGEPLIADFGFAYVLSEYTASMTIGNNKIVGTAPYIAPEIWDGNKPTVASDLYALACILIEMLTGTPIFQGSTTAQIIKAHLVGPRLPDPWPAGVPNNINSVLLKALSLKPSQRYETAIQFWDDLAALDRQFMQPLQGVEAGFTERGAVRPANSRVPDNTASPTLGVFNPQDTTLPQKGDEQQKFSTVTYGGETMASIVADRSGKNAMLQKKQDVAPVERVAMSRSPLWQGLALLIATWMSAGMLLNIINGLTFSLAVGVIQGLGVSFSLARVLPKYGAARIAGCGIIGLLLGLARYSLFEQFYFEGALNPGFVGVYVVTMTIASFGWSLIARTRVLSLSFEQMLIIAAGFALGQFVAVVIAQTVLAGLYTWNPGSGEAVVNAVAALLSGFVLLRVVAHAAQHPQQQQR